MKKVLSVLLILCILFTAAALTACGGSDSAEKDTKAEVDTENLSFSTLGELTKNGAEHEFIKSDWNLTDDLIVCTIKKDASGDLAIPAEYDGSKVIAVIGEDAANEKVTSVSIENGVSYIENCLSDSDIKSLSLPASLKGIFSAFNSSAGLTEVSFPSCVKYIVNSFNACGALEKIDTNGYIYGIKESFVKDNRLADVTFNGSLQKIEASFIDCGVTSLAFAENIHDIVASFSDCPALADITFEQIAGGVKDSFSSNGKLTTLTYQQGGEQILRSFNDNDSLENVDFGSGVGNITESFENCPKYTLPAPAAE